MRELFGRLGTVVDVPEALMRIAGATGGVGPAYWALLVEAQVDAAIRRGMPPQLASQLVAETMAGSAELLRAREYDTLALRRAVTSPGGTTARGLAALERGGVRAALAQAMDDVVDCVTIFAASVRNEIADFLSALLTVYVIVIIAWIVLSFIFAMGVRMPYYRWSNAVLDFLRDTANPWLNLFRRLPLRIGPLDLSPIVAIIVAADRRRDRRRAHPPGVSPARTTLAAGAVAAGVVALDQLTKALVRDGLALGERRDLVGRHRPRQRAQLGDRVRLPVRTAAPCWSSAPRSRCSRSCSSSSPTRAGRSSGSRPGCCSAARSGT